MVMPYLGPFNNPEFELIGEVIEFIRQMLERYICTQRYDGRTPTVSPRSPSYFSIYFGLSVPEIYLTVPWDAYKGDICALGNLVRKEFLQSYRDTDFMKPLVECMRQREPQSRPTANELVTMFQQLCKLDIPSKARGWLSPRTESAPERMLNDAVAAARDGVRDLKRSVG
ncbi:hypothetical protein BC628DRAFT_154996 [Trametes gibbosa]|nr:hypothetical protein BC628DRAFT_154996 [Trametes gibbosa]